MTAPAYPPTYYPGTQPQQYPTGPTAPNAKQLEYLHVKTRYRDQDMLSTFKMHVFSDESVLSQVAAELFSMYGQSEIKRNNAEHCISINRLGKSTHYAEGQLFRMLSRYGFTLRTSNSSIIPMAEHINDVLTMYVFAR